MKKHVLITMSVLMTLSAGSAFAAGPVRESIRTRFEREVKASVNTARATELSAQGRLEIIRELGALSKGRANAHELGAALGRRLSLNENGTVSEVNMMSIAQFVREAKKVADSINRNELDAPAKALMAEKDRALEVIPKFMALASSVSRPNAVADHVTNKEINAFTKELSLIESALTTMDHAELKSHLDIMDMAIESRARNPEKTGDQAMADALKAKFGATYMAKLDEILGCAR